MDTISKNDLQKQFEKIAGKPGSSKILGPLVALPKNALMTYLTAITALGAAGGAGIGAISSYIKTKNPKLTSLSRKKEFYDKKVKEMDNENWLNEVMTLKKKLETSKLSDEERTALEDQYIKLIDK